MRPPCAWWHGDLRAGHTEPHVPSASSLVSCSAPAPLATGTAPQAGHPEPHSLGHRTLDEGWSLGAGAERHSQGTCICRKERDMQNPGLHGLQGWVLPGHRPRGSGLRGQWTVLQESAAVRGPAWAPADSPTPRSQGPCSLPCTRGWSQEGLAWVRVLPYIHDQRPHK